MGPSIFVDGDPAGRSASAPTRSGFDGAVDLRRRRHVSAGMTNETSTQLQWGRRSSSTETAQAVRQGGDVGIELQWGRRSSSTETPRLNRDEQIKLLASMGPSIFVDGDASRSRLRTSCTARFNGAVDLRRRRRRAAARLDARRWLASMGPSIFVDGDKQVAELGPLAAPASMGPSIFVDGDPNTPIAMAPAVPTLQWGRRSSSTETIYAGDVRMFLSQLQWGRRSSSTETRSQQRSE